MASTSTHFVLLGASVKMHLLDCQLKLSDSFSSLPFAHISSSDCERLLGEDYKRRYLGGVLASSVWGFPWLALQALVTHSGTSACKITHKPSVRMHVIAKVVHCGWAEQVLLFVPVFFFLFFKKGSRMKGPVVCGSFHLFPPRHNRLPLAWHVFLLLAVSQSARHQLKRERERLNRAHASLRGNMCVRVARECLSLNKMCCDHLCACTFGPLKNRCVFLPIFVHTVVFSRKVSVGAVM